MGRFFCPVLLKYAAKPLAPKSVKNFFTAYVFLSQRRLLAKRLLKLFCKAYYFVCFKKIHSIVKSKAFNVADFAVACKFGAALLFCPCFAGGKQLICISTAAVSVAHKYTFKIPDRRRFGSFHIIMTKAALSKADRYAAFIF